MAYKTDQFFTEQDEPKIVEFLTELTALSRKHGIAIGGCGCCGSPYLFRPSPPDLLNQKLLYVVDRRDFGELRVARPHDETDSTLRANSPD